MQNFTLNKKLNVGVFSFILITVANSYSQSTQALENNRSTYIGIDAVYASTKLQPDFGRNVFSRKMAPGVNLSLGHMFNDYIGGEIGIEVDDPNSDINYVAGNKNELVFGVPVNTTTLIQNAYKSKINQNHSYFGIIAKANIFKANFISVLIGGSLSHFKAKANLFSQTFNNFGVISFDPTDEPSTFTKTKLIPIAKIILGYQCDNYTIKILSTWKRTSKITIKAKEYSSNNPEIIKLKNSINIGIGFSFYIV